MITQEPYSNIPYKIIRGKNLTTYKFFLNDCLSGMKNSLKDNSVDIVVTSPPYNIGINYRSYREELPRKEYLSWLKQISIEIYRVLKTDGSLFLNIGNRPKDQWIAWDVASKLRDAFILQNVFHWIKSIAINKQDAGRYPNITGDVAIGHYKPIVSSRFVNDCQEYIFHFTKQGNTVLDKLSIGVPYQDKSNIGRWITAKQDKRDRGNTWFIPYDTIQKRTERPHPASFPIKLPEMCIKLHGLREDLIVMDPFLGIGSTAVASSRLGVSFVGFETDPEYLKESILRLNSSMEFY